MMKLESAELSATLTGIFSDRAADETDSLAAGSSVAAIAI